MAPRVMLARRGRIGPDHAIWKARHPVSGDARDLPLFPLNTVLFPSLPLPLHIFEERYKRMIGHCMETSEPFGVVFRDPEGSAHRIGCTARVAEVLERFEDGRMNVVVAGEQPFRVLERFEAPEYPAGEVEPIDAVDDEDSDDPETADATRAAFAELVQRVSGEPPDPDQLEGEDAYAIAARVELPPETKQALLEIRSEPDRMRTLGEALRDLLAAVARSRDIADRAKMNGKVIVSP